MFYLITKERLLILYNSSKLDHKGVFNWFISPDKILNILVDMDNVRYIYKEHIDGIDSVIHSMLSKSTVILGTIDYEHAIKKEEDKIEVSEIKPSHREEEVI